MAQKRLDGECKFCNAETHLMGVGGLDYCPSCHHILEASKKHADGSWLVGFKVDRDKLERYADEGKMSKEEDVVDFLADSALVWGNAKEVKTQQEPFKADREHYVALRTCQLDAEGIALLKMMTEDKEEQWQLVHPNLPVPRPGFRVRPFLLDEDEDHSCYVDDANRLIVMSIAAGWIDV